VPTVWGRRAVGARSLRWPISVWTRRFSSNGDKLNRQIREVERLVTRGEQRAALSSNSQKFQFCKSKNLAAIASSTANLNALLTGLPAVFLEGLPRAFFAKSSVCTSHF
jgi:hypothetical protein